MLKRIVQVVSVCFLGLGMAGTRAEDNPEMQEMWQQMQAMNMKVMQNMTEKGIDPREFFGDMRQQMQDGTFDLAALQKKMVDQGLIDKETIAKVQSVAQNATLGTIKRQLGVTEEEWTALAPKIQRVITANAEAGTSGQMGRVMTGFMGGGQAVASKVNQCRKELGAVMANAATTPNELQIKLSALRDAVRSAQEELDSAKKDLIAVLTVRQEGTLVILGLL